MICTLYIPTFMLRYKHKILCTMNITDLNLLTPGCKGIYGVVPKENPLYTMLVHVTIGFKNDCMHIGQP